MLAPDPEDLSTAARVMLSHGDPILGEVRSFARYLLRSSLRQRATGTFIRSIMEREFRFHWADVGTDPSEKHVLWMRSPSRWNLILGLTMSEDLYRHQMTDHRGDIQVVEYESMSDLPGYFTDFARIQGYRKFNPNSPAMAVFYVLKYGKVCIAELGGSLNDLRDDMTLIKMVNGEEIARLEE